MVTKKSVKKVKSKKKSMNKEKKWCSPAKDNSGYTCYTIDDLKKLAKAYNDHYASKDGTNKIKIRNQTKKQLWNSLRKALSERCSNEICWAKQDFVGNKTILKETFRPKMPEKWKKENLTTWLNTDDINHVMKQYEKKYPDFLYLGTVPIDCGIESDLQCQLSKFDFCKAYDQGIRRAGIVYNTDTSYGNGQHWFGVYIDMTENGKINYYDSYASSMPSEIKLLVDKIQKNLAKKGLKMVVDKNRVRKQYDGFSCGIYSINFIIKMLEGKTIKQLDNMKLDTNAMQKLKQELYRNY